MKAQKASRLFLVALPLTMLAASLSPGCKSSNEAADSTPESPGGGTPDPNPNEQPDNEPNGGKPPAPAAETAKPPPDFWLNGKAAIFVDITRSDATLNIDVAAKKATVKSHMDIEIHQPEGGGPLLDVVPVAAKFVTVDENQKLPLAVVTSPDGKSTMRMVDGILPYGKHTLDFEEYALREGTDQGRNNTNLEGIEFANGGAEFLTDQDDTKLRSFTERYFPSGFESNRYPFTLSVNMKNAPASQKPDVMTNGKKEDSEDGRSFKISFRDNDNTSSWFLHVIDRNNYGFAEGEYKSVDGRSIPLLAYGKQQSDADLALEDMKFFLLELETDYGPYPHDKLLASLNGNNDPEEYDSAVQTDLDATQKTPEARGAMGHEILHQWFGRSARPFSGRSGWVDEAIAQWREDGYRRASSIKLNGNYVSLAVSSPYQRHTPDASYDQGSALLQGLDLLLKDQGGLKPLLKGFHDKFRDKLYTTEDFLNFLRQSAPDLKDQMEPLFVKKVYAGAAPPS